MDDSKTATDALLQRGAERLRGHQRRLFLAEVTVELCGGNARQAERRFGWGRETVDKFYSDHNHTYVPGADLVAAAIVSGLKAFPQSPFVPLLSDKGRAVATADVKYVSVNHRL